MPPAWSESIGIEPTVPEAIASDWEYWPVDFQVVLR